MGRTTGVSLCLVILLSVGSFIAAAEDTDSDGDGWIDSFEEACKTNPYDSQSCLLYTSPSPRDGLLSRMPSSA